jgi:hypothetical protein
MLMGQITFRPGPASAKAVLVAGLATMILMPGPVAFSQAVPTDPIVRVEEDWGLILNTPDDSVTSPQFHTVMSASGDTDSFYAQVVWNYRETPDFVAGGLELEAWNGEDLVQTKSGRDDPLSTTAETVLWTQVLETKDGVLSFRVENGQSVTWGTFGHGLHLSVAGGPENLNNYSPDVSVRSSCVTYGASRVDVLVLLAVRYYGPNGLIAIDETSRVVVYRFDDLEGGQSADAGGPEE